MGADAYLTKSNSARCEAPDVATAAWREKLWGGLGNRQRGAAKETLLAGPAQRRELVQRRASRSAAGTCNARAWPRPLGEMALMALPRSAALRSRRWRPGSGGGMARPCVHPAAAGRGPADTKYNMLTADDHNASAPWVPYTGAGCNVGAVATANTVLENLATDIRTVFGAGSPQAQEVASNPGQAFANFVGLAMHCAQANTLCSTANTREPGVPPQEPGGYTGYMSLFGNQYVAPQINPGWSMTDLNGNAIQDLRPPGRRRRPGGHRTDYTRDHPRL